MRVYIIFQTHKKFLGTLSYACKNGTHGHKCTELTTR